ncbi:phosphoribosyltransferase family protein [Teredinibacter turnerae]|uniref:phosphoribosyltransferase n=1 Tax=Teredinibacter turnerae TaxID=2426 RepID=UPI000376C472|nr:phosphoribosyltransferase family protein [Teredinibacter turnerae]
MFPSIANRLNRRYRSAVILTVVPGGILFTADLVRQLDFEIEMDGISCPHTPGDRHNNSNISYQQNITVSNKDVIIVDDAIESGGTMSRLVAHIAEYFPASIAVATLFVKPHRIAIPTEQYYAYETATDELLVGYGLPWQNKFRNLPCVKRRIK